MGRGLRQDGLHVVGRHIVAPADQRLRLRGTHQGDAGARRQALQEPAAGSGGRDQVLDVVQQRVGNVDLLDRQLQLLQLVGRKQRLQLRDHIATVAPCQELALSLPVGIAERNPHQEAVHLGLRQGVSAELVVRVLGGDHEERRGQGAGFAFDRDLFFLHRLQEGALGLGTGAVDFVGQQHLCKDRPRVKHKGLLAALEDGNARQVAGHQVGGELHPRELQTEGARQRVGQGGLAHPRDVFDQQVSAGQQAGHAVLDLGGFAHQHRVKLIEN